MNLSMLRRQYQKLLSFHREPFPRGVTISLLLFYYEYHVFLTVFLILVLNASKGD